MFRAVGHEICVRRTFMTDLPSRQATTARCEEPAGCEHHPCRPEMPRCTACDEPQVLVFLRFALDAPPSENRSNTSTGAAMLLVHRNRRAWIILLDESKIRSRSSIASGDHSSLTRPLPHLEQRGRTTPGEMRFDLLMVHARTRIIQGFSPCLHGTLQLESHRRANATPSRRGPGAGNCLFVVKMHFLTFNGGKWLWDSRIRRQRTRRPVCR